MLADKIRDLCYEKRMTIPQLAEKIGMSNSFYTTLKNGTLKLSTLQKIADVLEVQMIDLLDLKPLTHETEINIREQAIKELQDKIDNLNNTLKLTSQNMQLILEVYHFFENSLSSEEKKILSSNQYYEKFTSYMISLFGMTIWQDSGNDKMIKANKKLFDLANKNDHNDDAEKNMPLTNC